MTRSVRLQLLLLTAVLLAAFVLSGAQTPVQTQPQKKSAATMAPDRKAYSDANAIKEPDLKIAAMEKFIAEFPESSSVYSAHLAILDTLLKNHPEQRARLLEQAAKALDKAPEAAKANANNTIANRLSDAGVLMEEAEKYARKAVDLNQAERSKAAFLGTLGKICLKLGKLDEAEAALKDAAAANPQLAAVNLGLAELYDKRGNSEMALAAYVSAAATSKIPATARERLNALYAKSTDGSMVGLEEMLDAKYEEVNPPPFAVEPYQPSGKRSDRVVLAEVFTGSGCPPCVAADLAADLAMERYGRGELTMLMYHEHIPQPDPMTTSQTPVRFKYYNGTGVPTLAIDGMTTVGGGGRDAAKRVYDRITREIEEKLEVPAEATLKITAKRDGNTVRADVSVTRITGESPDLRLHIVLAEGKLRYTGENGVRFHPMVVRGIAVDDQGAQGLKITSREAPSFTWSFNIDTISADIKKHLDTYEAGGHRGSSFTFTEKKYQIDPGDLAVTAFVQDEKTKAVLQSVSMRVKP